MLLFKKRNTERRPPKTTTEGVLTALFATIAAIFAGLSLLGTAMALAATMPLFVVYSPVLVPAVITATLLATGIPASGSSVMTALTIFMWRKVDPRPPISSGHPGVTDGGKPAEKPAVAKPAPKHAAKPTSKPKGKPTIAASG